MATTRSRTVTKALICAPLWAVVLPFERRGRVGPADRIFIPNCGCDQAGFGPWDAPLVWQDGRVPDWTYHPLRRPMAGLLGERGSRRAAIGLVGALARVAPGRWLITGLGHTATPPGAATVVANVRCTAAVGASVGVAAARDAVRALPAL